ncbi:MAG TPA: hypothetical protein VGE10_05395 [Zeimonas sp.]
MPHDTLNLRAASTLLDNINRARFDSPMRTRRNPLFPTAVAKPENEMLPDPLKSNYHQFLDAIHVTRLATHPEARPFVGAIVADLAPEPLSGAYAAIINAFDPDRIGDLHMQLVHALRAQLSGEDAESYWQRIEAAGLMRRAHEAIAAWEALRACIESINAMKA